MSARATSPAVQLRSYRPEDAAACARIYAAGRRKAFWWCEPSRFQPSDFAADSRGESITVATLCGDVAGFVSLWLPDHFIHLLFVDPVLHRRGIGSILLGEACRKLAPWAWLKCQAQNGTALAFYESQGWSIGGGGTNEIGPWVAVSWKAGGMGRPSR